MKNEKIEKAFEGLPKKNLGLVSRPFYRGDKRKKVVALFSLFLPSSNKPKKKEDLLINSGILKKSVTEVVIGSYYSTCFSTLSKIGGIRYNTSTRSYTRGDNFQDYFEYLLNCMLGASIGKKLLGLLSEEQIQRLDKDLHGVALEMLDDEATMKTLGRIWRGDNESVVDFILNLTEED